MIFCDIPNKQKIRANITNTTPCIALRPVTSMPALLHVELHASLHTIMLWLLTKAQIRGSDLRFYCCYVAEVGQARSETTTTHDDVTTTTHNEKDDEKDEQVTLASNLRFAARQT